MSLTSQPSSRSARFALLGSYYPGIDGLRAVAILAVFLHHYVGAVYPWTFFWWGWTGVDLFFVISGFLITGILYDAKEEPRYFKNFYIRRALRIFPLFYALWLAFLALSVVFPVHWNIFYLLDALYLQNFIPFVVLHLHEPYRDFFVLNFSVAGHTLVINFYHFWSLCIEEQFYLLWPLMVRLLRRGQLMAICWAAIVLVPLLRLYVYLHPTPLGRQFQLIYTPTYMRFDTLLIGAALALWLRGSRPPAVTALRKYAGIVLVVGLAGAIGGHLLIDNLAARDVEAPFLCTWGSTFIGFACAAIVALCVDPATLPARLMNNKVFLHLGRISYGFYIFHYLYFTHLFRLTMVLRRHHLTLLGPLLAFVIAYVLARLSYRWLEMPFLRLKSRFADRKHVEPPLDLPAV